jgi:FlaA1/EpsC-like NDP-sugar epimerase
LAESLIRLNGFEPGRDIDIVFTGMRPGEKLFEELLSAEEGVMHSSHPKIFIAKFSSPIDVDFYTKVQIDFAEAGADAHRIRALFNRYLPTYSG